MAKTTRNISLGCSELELSTYYTANQNIFRRGPVSGHIVHLGRFYGSIDNGVEALGEAFESDDDALFETIALSGLREWIGSLDVEIGGSIGDHEGGIQYFKPSSQAGLRKLPGPYHYQCMNGNFGPYHNLLHQRISRYDLLKAIVHIMTNTELQDNYSKYGLPADPRLALVESVRSEPVA